MKFKRLKAKRKDKHDYYGEVKEIEVPEDNSRNPHFHRDVWLWIKYKLVKPIWNYMDEKVEFGMAQGIKQFIKSYGWILLILILLLFLNYLVC